MNLETLDIAILAIYAVGIFVLAQWVSREKGTHQKDAQDYFLASRALPWWAIGTSLIAANISAEQIVGMSGSADRRPHQLSGGQRQRVNIARALMNRPQVMLVDEPTAALDHNRSQQIMELLVEVTRRFDTATVVVTHDTEFVPLADRAVTMRDGRLS